MCGKLENMCGLHQREPLNQRHVMLNISPKNSWRCHNALKFTWELGRMILDLWIQAQEEPWSSSGKGYQDCIQNKTSLTNISYGESLLSQDSSTEEFMGLDLPLKSMKSLANANQALYTHSPMLSRWHSQQNTLRSLEGGAVEGLSGRRQCNLCGLEVILFMSKWACLFLSIVK